MKRLRYLSFIILIGYSAGFVTSCEDPTSILPAVNFFSDQDDVQLGQQVVDEMAKNPSEYPVWTTGNAASVTGYIKTGIVNEILKSTAIKKAAVYKYDVKIILKDSVLNAFALPGGPIYVYTGLLKFLDSEAALAGVIGHEIAHAELRHATTRMSQQYGISILLSVVLGEKPSELAQIAANLFVGLALLQNSRANEDESDQASFDYLKSSKYYAGSVKFFFEKLKADGYLATGGGKLEAFLSTHPQPEQRISLTDGRLNGAGIPVINYSYTGSAYNLYRSQYQSNIVSKLP